MSASSAQADSIQTILLQRVNQLEPPATYDLKKARHVMLILREFSSNDQASILSIHEESQLDLDENVPADYFNDLLDIESAFSGGSFVVAAEENDVVGYGGLLPSGEIVRMRVAATHRRRGIANRILSALIARAAELNFEKVHLHTLEQQIGAQKLYENAGFHEVFRGEMGQNWVVGYEREV